MELIFLDTSALLKIYVPEIGSGWLKGFVTGKQIVISELALFESATALRRRQLEGTFTKTQASDLLNQILVDSMGYQIVGLGGKSQLDKVIDLAFNLPSTLRIRALDSIHLAAAGIAREAASVRVPPVPFTFVSSDVPLLNVAQAQGFTVENPENYP